MARATPISLAVQVLSFASSVALATYLGASYVTDAYYLAVSIPMLVYGIVVGGIRVGFIPALTDEDNNDDRSFSNAAAELLTAVFFSALALAVVSIGLSILVLPLLAGEADTRTVTLARSLVLELSTLTVTGALTGALGAILTVRGRYVAPIAVMGLEPIVRISLLAAASAALGAHALVLGNVVGSAAAVAILWTLLVKEDIRPHFRFSRGSVFLRTAFAVSGPLLVGQVILQANPVVDRLMASSLETGSITVLELGYRMFGVSTVVLVSTLIAPVTATWAARYRSDGWHSLRESAFRAMHLSLLVLPPIVVLSVALKDHIVTFLYRGGEFTAADVSVTADVFGFYMLALPAEVLTGVAAAVFIIRKNTITPMKIAAANVFLNAGLDYVFLMWFGVAGIALSTTVTYTLLWLLFLVALSRRYGALGLRRLLPTARKVTLAIVGSLTPAIGVASLFGVPDDRLSAAALLAGVGTLGVVGYYLILSSFGEAPSLKVLLAPLLRT